MDYKLVKAVKRAEMGFFIVTHVGYVEMHCASEDLEISLNFRERDFFGETE